MQMINVLKRLAELDSTNPNVSKSAMTQEQSLATVTNIEGKRITECGMMGGMERPSTPASFSINASAANGNEVSSMLRDIMNLAGVKPVADEPAFAEPSIGKEIELEPAHSAEPVDDMADMIGMIDKMNSPGDSEIDITPVSSIDNSDEVPDVGDMADEVRSMTDEIADENTDGGFGSTDTQPNQKYKTDDAGDSKVTIGKQPTQDAKASPADPVRKEDQFESLAAKLLKDYQQFVSESNK